MPVTRDRLHCLHRGTLQFLQKILSEEAQPEEYLHMGIFTVLIKKDIIQIKNELSFNASKFRGKRQEVKEIKRKY